MIDVSAKLIRGPVYLTGECVECYITFSNPPVPQHKKSQSNSDVLESLAWASVQIHCQCSTNSKVAYPDSNSISAEELSTSNTDTSFAPCRGERGHIVLSTKPRILFCDLRLSAGESKSYVYSETLPCEAPPSYRGQAVKYSYKITIGMQRINCPIKLLRVPLRVLEVNGFMEHGMCGDSEDLTPTNPFLEIQRRETPLDVALQVMQNITARRTPNFYNITNTRGKVVRFCLFKQAYKLGEDIVGTFDFSDATIPCVQFSVVLQSEEEINPGCKRWAKLGPAIVSYSKYHEVCLNMKRSQLILPIPLHITPAFATKLVTLKWRLHFEFVTTLTPLTHHNSSSNAYGKVLQGPSSLDIETMIWNLPVNIYSTTPLQLWQLDIQHEGLGGSIRLWSCLSLKVKAIEEFLLSQLSEHGKVYGCSFYSYDSLLHVENNNSLTRCALLKAMRGYQKVIVLGCDALKESERQYHKCHKNGQPCLKGKPP